MIADRKPSGLRPFSTGYGVILGVALIGMVLLAISLGGVYELRHGGDPMDAINSWGIGGLLFVWLLAYLFRFIFWRRVPERRQQQVRIVLVGTLIGELILTVVTVWLLIKATGSPGPAAHASEPWSTAVIAAFCQIATITWLVRYRRE